MHNFTHRGKMVAYMRHTTEAKSHAMLPSISIGLLSIGASNIAKYTLKTGRLNLLHVGLVHRFKRIKAFSNCAKKKWLLRVVLNWFATNIRWHFHVYTNAVICIRLWSSKWHFVPHGKQSTKQKRKWICAWNNVRCSRCVLFHMNEQKSFVSSHTIKSISATPRFRVSFIIFSPHMSTIPVQMKLNFRMKSGIYVCGMCRCKSAAINAEKKCVGWVAISQLSREWESRQSANW